MKKLCRRSEPRSVVDQYYSVEFSIGSTGPIAYQFKIRNISKSGMGILVKEDSDLLEHLSAGDLLNMKYYPVDLSEQPKHLKTEIKHITKDDQGRFKGHYLVGLSVVSEAF
ncbi:MAG: PilZ domain-containing protein [Desulfobacterales bacterium]